MREVIIEANCPVCGAKKVGCCRCGRVEHDLESLRKGHGVVCANGHRWSSKTVDGNIIAVEIATGKEIKVAFKPNEEGFSNTIVKPSPFYYNAPIQTDEEQIDMPYRPDKIKHRRNILVGEKRDSWPGFEYEVQGFYSGQWEMVYASEHKNDALDCLKEYRENERGIQFKLVRVKSDDSNDSTQRGGQRNILVGAVDMEKFVADALNEMAFGEGYAAKSIAYKSILSLGEKALPYLEKYLGGDLGGEASQVIKSIGLTKQPKEATIELNTWKCSKCASTINADSETMKDLSVTCPYCGWGMDKVEK